jgi:hypothetical protein
LAAEFALVPIAEAARASFAALDLTDRQAADVRMTGDSQQATIF